MSDIKNVMAQWFIVKVIAGKEKSIIENIKERIQTYGYENLVPKLDVINIKETSKKIFDKNDVNLPKEMKNTKNIQWETLPNGSYTKFSTKTTNKFPGYIFVKMYYNQDVWFLIRNTQGVLGFVGSSGKGTKPVPISEQQYLDSLHGSVNVSSSKSIVVDEINNDNIKPTIKFAPNMVVEIAIGKFAGQSGKITNINNEIGIAEIELDNLGKVEVPYSDIKK